MSQAPGRTVVLQIMKPKKVNRDLRYPLKWNNSLPHLDVKSSWDFPGGAVVKNLPANAGDVGSNPGLGRSPMTRSN